MGCQALLQGIFPTQGSHFFCLLHWQVGTTTATWEAPWPHYPTKNFIYSSPQLYIPYISLPIRGLKGNIKKKLLLLLFLLNLVNQLWTIELRRKGICFFWAPSKWLALKYLTGLILLNPHYGSISQLGKLKFLKITKLVDGRARI